jgi:hypothetical protein
MPNKNKKKSNRNFGAVKDNIELIDMPDPLETSSNETDEQEWSFDIEDILNRICQNCSIMSKHHKSRYLALKGKLVYFRVPLIILGGANSVMAVGLVAYLQQQSVSLINCILSLICAIITSIELFLGIQAGMEKELTSQRDFYLMAVDINSVLSLERRHRSFNGKRYLEKMLSQYNKLIGESEVLDRKMEDKLINIPFNNQMSEKLTEIICESPSNNNLV